MKFMKRGVWVLMGIGLAMLLQYGESLECKNGARQP
jgi:hypothetical protein